MDAWTDPYPDVAPPDKQPRLPDQGWREIEARRLRAQQAVGLDALGEAHALEDVPLPLATAPGVALAF